MKSGITIKILLAMLSLALCLSISSAQAQPTLEWFKSTAGRSNDEGYAITTDLQGYIYVTGRFSGMFDANLSVAISPVQSDYLSNMFVCKYDSSGNLIWSRTLSALGATDIITDSLSNVYFTGAFSGIVDFDPGPGVYHLAPLSSSLPYIYVCSLDSSGNFKWANWIGLGTSGSNMASSVITLDDSLNVYLTGRIPTGPFVSKFDLSGNMVWNKTFGAAGFIGKGIAVDPNGNVISAGDLSFNSDMDPGSGIYNLKRDSGSIYILKLDMNGNFMWAINFGDPNNSVSCYSLDTDSSGNLLVSGRLTHTGDFDPGPNTFMLSPTGPYSPCFSIYDSSGNFIYAGLIEGYGVSYASVFDSDNNYILAGHFRDSADFDPGPGTMILTAGNNAEAFIAKYSMLGNLIWARSFGGNLNEFIHSINTDINEDILITGAFSGTADFDPSAGVMNLSATSPPNVFISKLDSSGNLKWAGVLSGASVTNGEPDVDANGYVYMTGGFEGRPDLDPGSNTLFPENNGDIDCYIRKFNSSGDLLWAKTLGGPGNEYCINVKCDNSGNIYVAGYFKDSIDADPGPGQYMLYASTYWAEPCFIVKLDSTGSFIWALSLNESEFPSGFIRDMDVDGSGNLFLTGSFTGSVDLDPGPGVHMVNSIDHWDDTYFLKLNTHGGFEWGFSIGIHGEDEYGFSVTVDGFGNSYFSGIMFDSTDFDRGPGVMMVYPEAYGSSFILKLNPGGFPVWVKQIYGLNSGLNYLSPPVLHAFSLGELSMTGAFNGEVDLDPGPSVDLVNSSNTSSQDMYVIKLSSAGNRLWKSTVVAPIDMVRMGVSICGDDFGNTIIGGEYHNIFLSKIINICVVDSLGNITLNVDAGTFNSRNPTCHVHTDQHNNIYLSGVYSSKSDFDLTSGNLFLNPSSDADVFLAKYHSINPACSTAPSSIISDATNNHICIGNLVTLSQVGGALGGNGTFEWFLDSCSGTSIGSGPSLTISLTDTTIVYVRVVDSCGVSSCVDLTLYPLALPVIPNISGNMLFCQGDSIVLDAGSGYAEYSWSTGATSQSLTVNAAGNYSVVVSDVNGCESSSMITVSTFPPPVVSIIPSGTVEICLGDTVLFEAFTGNGVSLQWMLYSNPIPGEVNLLFQATSAGQYSCYVTDTFSCGSFSAYSKVKVICMPPEDPQQRTEGPAVLTSYDPTIAVLSTTGRNLNGNRFHATLTDLHGRIIKQQSGSVILRKTSTNFDCTGLSGGFYLMSFATEKEIITRLVLINAY